MEEWKAIPGFEGLYEASSHGKVRGIKFAVNGRPPRLKKGWIDPYGYCKVCLTKNNKWRPFTVSALVCSAFHGERPSGLQVAHEDGIRTNDHKDNLSWKTPLQQAADKNRHGTTVMGERQHLAKLTEKDVVAIRLAHNGRNGREMAARYGVTASCISSVVNRKTWRHV